MTSYYIKLSADNEMKNHKSNISAVHVGPVGTQANKPGIDFIFFFIIRGKCLKIRYMIFLNASEPVLIQRALLIEFEALMENDCSTVVM